MRLELTAVVADSIKMRDGILEQGIENGRNLLATHPQAALKQAHTLLALVPDPRAFRLAATAHRALGQADEAEIAELHAIQKSLAIPLVRRAVEAEQAGRAAEAGALAAQQLAQQSDDLLAMTISAAAAIDSRRLVEAEKLLRFVLERAPSFLRASMMLARSLNLQCRTGEAIDVMKQGVSRHPRSLPAQRLLAQCYSEVGDHVAAAAVYEALIADNGEAAHLWLEYGSLLRFLGRRDDSAAAYRRALASNQTKGSAWWGLTNLDAAGISDQDIDQIKSALDEAVAPGDVIGLHFALGAALDFRAMHQEAFHHYSLGNAAGEAAEPYDPAILSSDVDRAIELYTSAFFSARTHGTSANATPIFVIGMPRSGSTLVERILGRHSQIEATGELPIIPRLIENASAEHAGRGDFGEFLSALPGAELRKLGQAYLDSARGYRKSDKAFFTDKLHLNWRHIGFIHLILPSAMIIDVRRNALDCCWSNYRLRFSGHPAANKLENLGNFYTDYVRMMDHMAVVAPASLLKVQYEHVVDDIERETHRILDFVGLPFQSDCLDFHLSVEPVATASSEQVRQPLNRKGIGVSTPYSQWLGALRQTLGPLVEA